MKIVTIIGARSQFIKAAAISRTIAEHNKKSEDTIQFRQKLDRVLRFPTKPNCKMSKFKAQIRGICDFSKAVDRNFLLYDKLFKCKS
ncbi:MAG: hypothetical protein CSYNP_03338 [Syntrophus sp. SKADARSKE-3]|nr:hypothetical protein [Syntrophus sp. SKADARSKE-3]